MIWMWMLLACNNTIENCDECKDSQACTVVQQLSGATYQECVAKPDACKLNSQCSNLDCNDAQHVACPTGTEGRSCDSSTGLVFVCTEL